MRDGPEMSKVSGCILCGATGLTRSHYVPRAVRKVLPRQSTSFTIMGELSSLEPQLIVDLTQKSYGRGTFDTQPKVLCGPCNNAWMTSYENVAGPLLARMIEGSETLRVNDGEARAIATWAAAATLIRSMADMSIQHLSPDLMREFRQHDLEAVGARVSVLSLANSRTLFAGDAVGSTYIFDADEPTQSALGLVFLKNLVVAVGFGRFAWHVEKASQVLSSALVLTWPNNGSHQGWPTTGEVLDSTLMSAFGVKDLPRSMFIPATPIRGSAGSERSVVRLPQAFTSTDVTMD